MMFPNVWLESDNSFSSQHGAWILVPDSDSFSKENTAYGCNGFERVDGLLVLETSAEVRDAAEIEKAAEFRGGKVSKDAAVGEDAAEVEDFPEVEAAEVRNAKDAKAAEDVS